MTTREALHRLIDAIPGNDLDAVERVIEPFVDPVALSLANAPLDDEEETEEERAAVAEGRAALDAGDFVTLEDLRREIGI